jgi:signal transduction histidine kinase
MLLALAGLGSVVCMGLYGLTYHLPVPYKKKISNLFDKRDASSGLIAYGRFIRQLERSMRSGERTAVVIVDCSSSSDTPRSGVAAPLDRIVRQVAALIRQALPEAKLIARYGKDQIAVAYTPIDDMRMGEIKRLFQIKLAKQAEFQPAYGIAVYPDDGETHEQLLLAAISEMKAMKQQLAFKREIRIAQAEKLRMIGELASGMAHEIRNPLTTIKGFLQLSRIHGYNVEPWYELIMQEIDRMGALTSEFLRFSKPKLSDFRPFSIHTCIQRAISLMELEVSRLGHRICYMGADPSLHVYMDQDKIVQLLLNLVKNALEAMPNQGQLTVRLSRTDEDAVIEVCDTGVGMSDDELSHIFQPFYTSKEDGTGLGLPICLKIAHDHGGKIEAESVMMQGTTIRLKLPLSPATGAV